MKRNQESMIGDSPALSLALERVSNLAAINRPALILGERGTGKELAAQRIHYLSPRWEAPLHTVNCAAIAESLLDSELFGHEAGAFTGATKMHRGRFERANGGTLFLDELGNMSLRLQEKLLRVVEYGEFQRLGGSTTLQVDVRIVAATNADLKELGRIGRFREDLLDRLSFDVIHLPTLRHRREDIGPLAEHFALQMCSELGWELFPGFSPNALQILLKHPWPGNIRELKNTVERSLYRWADATTPVDSIVLDPFVSPYTDPHTGCNTGSTIESNTETVTNSALSRDDSLSTNLAEPVAADTTMSFTQRMAQIERNLLQESLAHHAGNQRQTAQTLGLSYDQLRGLVRKHQLASRKVK